MGIKALRIVRDSGNLPLVIALLPDERLSHSVNSWLSAGLSFVVPSFRTNWQTVVDAHSLELDSADFGEAVSSLLAGLLSVGAFLLGGEDGSLLLLRLDAVVVILGVSFWTFHSTVAASYSLEQGVALGLEGGWGDLLAVVLSVGSLASGLGWGKFESAFGDFLLD